jgi:hypothetical protein
VPLPDPERGPDRTALYKKLIALRLREIAPFLDHARVLAARVIGPKAVVTTTQLSRSDGEENLLTIAANLDAAPVPFEPPPGRVLFANAALPSGTLPGHCTAAFLGPAR